MAGLRLVPLSVTVVVFGLAGFAIAWEATPARAQGPYTQQYPENPPTYRNTGNAITQGPREGEVNIDLNNRNALDPLAARSSERAALRSATPTPARPLSQSFDPALQPASVPTGPTTSAVPAPPPGSTRMPAQVPPRSAYPALSAPPAPPSTDG